jgi:hypothetical protein
MHASKIAQVRPPVPVRTLPLANPALDRAELMRRIAMLESVLGG